jgi:alkylation response protein AidB-like acyl-CoA dehydrogenase
MLGRDRSPTAQEARMASPSLPVGAGFLWERVGSREIETPERFSEDQRAIARSGREFSEQEILPHLAAIEAKKPGLVPSLLKKAGELGLLMVDIPSEYGGLGLDKTTSMLLAEQFSRVGSFSVSLGAHTGIGTLPIVYFGTPAQKAAYLPDLGSGKRLAAYALTESASGSDALAAHTKAVKSADGQHWIIDGSKQFITNGGFADVFVVFAKIDGKDFSAFIVDRNTPGLSVGAEEHKMGIRGSSTTSLAFENMKVPVANLLGEQGKGHRIAFNILNLGRIKLGVGTIGGCKFALDISARYASERKQFDKPIGSFGLVADKLAEMAIGIFVGETAGYRTTGMLDQRLAVAATDDAKVDAIDELTIESSIIKVFGSETLDYCTDEAVQVHGGYGFIEEYEPERLLRDSRINRIFEGTNEINRLIVPGTILKRALKGRVPLLAQAAEIRKSLAAGKVPERGEGEIGIAEQVAEACKWLSIYTLAIAAETYHVNIAEEQEVLGAIADMIGKTYVLDSVVARVKQAQAGDPARLGFMRDALTAFAPRCYGSVLHAARHVLSDVCPENALAGHQAAVSKLRIDWPVKVLAAKRSIAKQVMEAGGYPLR